MKKINLHIYREVMKDFKKGKLMSFVAMCSDRGLKVHATVSGSS